jgi:aspartate aminotransferase
MTSLATKTALLAQPRGGAASSPNLALNEEVERRRAQGERLVHLGFGEARLPLLPSLADALAEGAATTGYGSVAGHPPMREAVAGYFTRRELATSAEQVVVGPGSKPLLFAVSLALDCDIVIPRPSWNSYAPQIRMSGNHPIPADIPVDCGGIPDPDQLRRTVRGALAAGYRPGAIVLTVPDNPTGTFAGPSRIRALCQAASELGLAVISDEIYRDLVHDPTAEVLSAAQVLPEHTVVSTGLSKTLGIGGWRIGALRFPDGPWGRRLQAAVTSVASDAWSSLAGPMQHVGAYAFSEPPDVRSRVRAAAAMHGALARAVHQVLVARGAHCRPPTAAFYVYPDLSPRRAQLSRHGARDSDSLQRVLLQRHGVAVLAGHHLGDDPAALRFKAATSVLCGDTAEQQHQALESDDPAALPHVQWQLRQLGAALDDLAS